VKNNGYDTNYDNIMNLAQAMLEGRRLEASIFLLAILAFDIQSGWRDAYERQREYTRRDLIMGKLNPEKYSQRQQDLNRYLDFILIEKTSDNHKITKAYGKSLPEDEIRSIMGRAIPP
jgi:hypothetical protein